MSHRPKREIIVLGAKYYWVLDGNSVADNCGEERHIRVHSEGQTKCLLYIDPTPWHFEIRPRMIKRAIEYSITHGWKPGEVAEAMYISMQDDQFYVLPKGIKFAYQDKSNEIKSAL